MYISAFSAYSSNQDRSSSEYSALREVYPKSEVNKPHEGCKGQKEETLNLLET